MAKTKKKDPTGTDLAAATHELKDLRNELTAAQRSLEAANSISTISHREPEVARWTEIVADLRERTQAKLEEVAAIKDALGTGRLHRTSALGKRPGKKAASAAAKSGTPASRKSKKPSKAHQNEVAVIADEEE